MIVQCRDALLKAYTCPDKICNWQVGKYKDSAGIGACKSCDEWRGNTYTAGTGSTSTDACTCNAGYFGECFLSLATVPTHFRTG